MWAWPKLQTRPMVWASPTMLTWTMLRTADSSPKHIFACNSFNNGPIFNLLALLESSQSPLHDHSLYVTLPLLFSLLCWDYLWRKWEEVNEENESKARGRELGNLWQLTEIFKSFPRIIKDWPADYQRLTWQLSKIYMPIVRDWPVDCQRLTCQL